MTEYAPSTLGIRSGDDNVSLSERLVRRVLVAVAGGRAFRA